jgi:hypothetical protein
MVAFDAVFRAMPRAMPLDVLPQAGLEIVDNCKHLRVGLLRLARAGAAQCPVNRRTSQASQTSYKGVYAHPVVTGQHTDVGATCTPKMRS